MRRDQLNDQYLELLDQQRLYFKTVKDFKEVHKDKLAANADPGGCRAGLVLLHWLSSCVSGVSQERDAALQAESQRSLLVRRHLLAACCERHHQSAGRSSQSVQV